MGGSRDLRPWSPAEEARLLLWAATADRQTFCRDFARATGRTRAGVRTKLCRLRKEPLLAPPEFNRDAAAPRVPSARGPNDTPDKQP